MPAQATRRAQFRKKRSGKVARAALRLFRRAQGRHEGGRNQRNARKPRYDFGNFADGRNEHQRGERANRPIRAVGEVQKFVERLFFDENHGHGAHEKRAHRKTECDNHDVFRESKRPKHAVERERRVNQFEVYERRKPRVFERKRMLLRRHFFELAAGSVDCQMRRDARNARKKRHLDFVRRNEELDGAKGGERQNGRRQF